MAHKKSPKSDSSNKKHGASVASEISVPSIEVKEAMANPSNAVSSIDRGTREKLLYESDEAYREITNDIINATTSKLDDLSNGKKPIRWALLIFMIVLLSLQFICLIVILVINSFFNLKISDMVINTYIVSVFAETLAGLIIMIKFSFDFSQEVELISILNSIVKHFKKYGDNESSNKNEP